MATICKKCGGIILDLGLDFIEGNDCKNHQKAEDMLHPKRFDDLWG